MKKIIKILICGSVDDGKSTFLGKFLKDTNNIFFDQEQSLKKISNKYGTQGSKIDYALLLDGLEAEREQGITIDVAYRYVDFFNTRFVLIDSPGHEQYTRNVITAASNCDIALVLVDISRGLTDQTYRHLRILDLIGIEDVIIAINKIDLTKNKTFKKFSSIKKKIIFFCKRLKFKNLKFFPISALNGDNIIFKSSSTKFFNGGSIFHYIKKININKRYIKNFLFSVQLVRRKNINTRLYYGTINSGVVKNNNLIKILPSNKQAKIVNIYYLKNKIKTATQGMPVALELDKQIDISRGDIFCDNQNNIIIANAFQAKVFITGNLPLLKGREYIIRIHNKESKILISKIKNRLDILTGNDLAASQLKKNDIGVVEFKSYEDLPVTEPEKFNDFSRFILIDKDTFETVAAGFIIFVLRKSQNIFFQKTNINKKDRIKLINQKPYCIWFTGLSGSGKSTLANVLEKKLYLFGKLTYLLDGDNLRLGINSDLGFLEADRVENIRRVAQIAKILVDSAMIVLVSTISPYKKDRDYARSLFNHNEFIEIFVNTPIEICEKRDPKNLYDKYKKGKIKNLTGKDSQYEEPLNPELIFDTSKENVDTIIKKIMNFIKIKNS